MWTYLPTPENSIAVWRLVGNAWGQENFEQVVGLHQISSSFAWIEGEKIIALANIAPVHSMTSGWLSVWLCPEWRRKNYNMRELWYLLHVMIFKDLGFKALMAVTKDATVARLATRYGARRDRINNLYGQGRDGYIAIWD